MTNNKIITTDTIWHAGQTINLTANVQIAHGVSLTIEPGAVVNGNGYQVQAFGALKAIGTTSRPINFNNIILTFSSDYSQPGNIDIAHARINGGAFLPATGNGSYGSFDVTDSSFTSVTGFYIWYPVSESHFERNVFSRSSGLSIGTDGVKVYVTNNVFSGQTVNVHYSLGNPAIENWASYRGVNLIVQYNSFLSTDKLALMLPDGYSSAAIFAENNYFGTTNTSNIAERIYDKSDSLSSASIIDYQPFLTQPDKNTPILPNSLPSGTIEILGAAQTGGALIAFSTLSDADGMGSLSYQWLADGKAISDATSNSLLLTKALIGKIITVKASYTDGFGTVESVASAATAAVSNVNSAPTGSISIAGTAQQDQVLTVSNTLADSDGLGVIAYQWLADGQPITGATGSSLTLSHALVGKAISVVASYTDGGGAAESVSSTATATVLDHVQTLTGSSGNDHLTVNPGCAMVDAGAGNDSVYLPLFPNTYHLSSTAEGAAGSYGGGYSLELYDVESVEFGSQFKTSIPLIDLVSGKAQDQLSKLTDLYLAFFGRAPDVGGLEYWLQQSLQGGQDFTVIAQQFAKSTEAQALFPAGSSNRDFVKLIYENCFNREPDAAGWDYWSQDLDIRGSTDLSGRGVFIANVILGAYSSGSGLEDRSLLGNKHDVAMYYANQLSQQPSEGFDAAVNDLLGKVNGDAATARKAEAVIDYAFLHPVTLSGVMGDAALLDSIWNG